MASARFGDVSGDAFSDMIESEFLFGVRESPRNLNPEGVAVKKCKGSTDHSHVLFEDFQHFFKHGFHVAFMSDDRADLLDDQKLRIDRCFHIAGIFHEFG